MTSARRIIQTWAADAAAFAQVLAVQDPTWRSEAHELAGGWLVLSGAGLYVNVAVGVGIDAPLTDDDVDLIVERSAAVGVVPSVEVSPITHPATIELLAARGFVPIGSDTQVFARDVDLPAVAHPDDVVVRPVRSGADLALWQEVSALGWGHATDEARHAADTFAVAAHAIDGEGKVIAFDASDGRPIGCASLTVRDHFATLGGMSTVPAERGRGVQAALIHHRLHAAADRGCDVATSRAVAGGASARNLARHGCAPQFVIQTWRAEIASPAVPLRLREYHPDDLPAIHVINEAAYPAVGTETIEALGHIAGESVVALVADEPGTGTIAGFCLVLAPGADYGSMNYRWFADRYDDFVYLDRVAISPDFQRRGLGRDLYAEVERLAAGRRPGATQFTLEVNLRPRNDQSLAFHAGLGFVEVGQHETDYGTLVSLMAKPM